MFHAGTKRKYKFGSRPSSAWKSPRRLRGQRPRKYNRRPFSRVLSRRAILTKRLGVVIPDQINTKFRAVGTWVPASAIGGGFQQFYANNAYDPVVGISTTKCSGFTQMMSIYTYGIVYACKIEAKLMTNTVNTIGFILWDDSTTNLTATTIPSLDLLTECPRDSVWKHQAVYQYNEVPIYLKMFKKIKALERKSELEPSSYKFDANNGPAKACGVQVGYIPADTTNATAFLAQMFIRITYYCRLFNRKTSTIAE